MKNKKSGYWFVPDSAELIWQTWDDEVVVFDCRSGDTHLLDLVGAEALKILKIKSLTKDQLVQDMSISFNTEIDRQLTIFIESLLKEFLRLGLVERSVIDGL